MLLKDAMDIAMPIWESLKPVCDIRKIAGSIRREKPEPKDIEIVCLPKFVVLKDMFGWDEGTIRDPLFHKIVSELGTIIKGKTDGKYMQIELPQGINLDLFMPDEANFWRIMAIRTGPSDYSQNVLAVGWRKMGWVGSDVGLRKEEDCENVGTKEKAKWKCVKLDGELPPKWESEKHFYQWLQVPYLEPKHRGL